MSYYYIGTVLFFALVQVLWILISRYYTTALESQDREHEEIKRKSRNLNLGIAAWLLFTAALSISGFVKDFSSMPPRFVIVVLPPMVFVLYMISGKKLNRLLHSVSQDWLIGIQTFRILMEILLWMLFLDLIIPEQMTFEGRNFDILAGLSAPFIVWYFRKTKSKKMLIVWNILCLLLLMNIVTVALLSAPLPIRYFMNEPANTVIARFPWVWLPGFVVPVAYTMHFLSLKKLMMGV